MFLAKFGNILSATLLLHSLLSSPSKTLIEALLILPKPILLN